MIGHIVGFRRLRQIASSVSSSFVIWCIASRVSLRLFLMEFLGSGFFFSSILLYAVACVRVANLAPCILNSGGTSRSNSSGSSLLAPSLARRSLSLFPSVPLWPLIHFRLRDQLATSVTWLGNGSGPFTVSFKKFIVCLQVQNPM